MSEKHVKFAEAPAAASAASAGASAASAGANGAVSSKLFCRVCSTEASISGWYNGDKIANQYRWRKLACCLQGLAAQDLGSLDVTKLTPLTPEVISRQATINIGTIGHVAHGKSTVVKAISGVKVGF